MVVRIVVAVLGGAWRLKAACVRTRLPLLKQLLIRLYGMYQYENTSSIAWNADFAGEPCFPHGMKSIFVSGGARIGKDCVIFQQVTIGSNTLADSKSIGAPVIGDNCYIGAGAKIIGRVTIGNNVRIGANAVVYKDVGDNAVVLSAEQRVIEKAATPDNRFYSFRGGWARFENGAWRQVSDMSRVLETEQDGRP